MIRRAAPLAVVAALAAACARGPQSPAEAWDAVQEAVRTRDTRLLHDLADVDTLEHRRQVLRHLRGLLLRGDPPERALAGSALTPDDVLRGTLDDAVGRLFVKHSPLVRDGEWFLGARVEREVADGPDAACLELRGADGNGFSMWFVNEPRAGGRRVWVVDFGRTWLGP